ncbi:MAG: TolC family protein, partial [Rikenellaceae bacterium]|nr:TolC family protein [Rikenellaceae bacterium]
TVLEANKIESMYLSVSAQYRKAVAERDNNLRKMRLLASLPQTFTVTDSVYPAFDVDVEGFVARAVGMDYDLEQAAIDTLIAERQLRLSRSERLPGFKVGYRLSMEAREPSHGVIAGLSIPLWGRAGSVKAAKASQQAARKSMEAKRALLEAELEGVKESYLASVSILDDYRRLLKGRSSVEVLAKALDAGELSMLDYFVELNVWNDTLMAIVESEHEAALAAAFMQLCVTEF